MRQHPGDRSPPGIRLTPIVLSLLIALGHGAGAYRLAPLARMVGSPRSSVQRALRSLVADGLVEETGPSPHRYRLGENLANEALITVALLRADPEHALLVTLRASSAIAHVVEAGSTKSAILAPDAAPADIDRLERTLALLRARGDSAPIVRIAGLNELAGSSVHHRGAPDPA